jgi:hypothetical protein
MENKNNISESLVDRLNGMRSFFNKKEKKNDNSVDLNTNDVKSNSRTDKAKSAVTNNAFYTTIHEGQIKPLKKGEGLANIFARIYNLMKLQNEEEKRHYELERNFQKRQSKGFTPFMREKKDLTVSKEDKKDDKDKNASLMGTMFGLLFKGIKTIVGGMIGVITSSVGFLASTVFSLAKVATKIIGFIPSLLSGLAGITGLVTSIVDKLVTKIAYNLISRVFMPLVYRGIMFVASSLGELASIVLGPELAVGLAAILGVSAASYAYSKIPDIKQYALEQAFTQDRKGGPKQSLEELKKERDEKLQKLESKWAYTNNLRTANDVRDPGHPDYLKERDKILNEYAQKKDPIDKRQEQYFKEFVLPKLNEEGYTVDYNAPDADTTRYSPKGMEGLSIPRIFDPNGKPLTDLEMDMLAVNFGLTKKVSSIIADSVNSLTSDAKSSPLYTDIKKAVEDTQSYLESLKTKITTGIESTTNTMGQELDKLFKEFNIAKDEYDMLPPIVIEETHNYNSKGEETGTVIDYSAPVRTDDGTLKRLQEKNLRPF